MKIHPKNKNNFPSFYWGQGGGARLREGIKVLIILLTKTGDPPSRGPVKFQLRAGGARFAIQGCVADCEFGA